MTILYDKDLDYLEIFFKRAENYAEELTKFVNVFKSEKKDEIVGYSFENASHTVFESAHLSSNAKLAALLRMFRAKEKLTQEQVAEKIKDFISFRHYQRLESGDENTTLDTLENFAEVFPQVDFSKVLKRVG